MLGLSSGYSGTKHSGLLASHRPSTLAVSVPLEEKSIIRMDNMHVPRPFWRTFS